MWRRFWIAIILIVAGIVAVTVFHGNYIRSIPWFVGLVLGLIFLSFVYSSAEMAFTLLQESEQRLLDEQAQRAERAQSGTSRPEDDLPLRSELADWERSIEAKYPKGSLRLRVRRRTAQFIRSRFGEREFRQTLAIVLIMNNAVNLGFVVWIGSHALTADAHWTKNVFEITWTVLPVLVIGEIMAKAAARRSPARIAAFASPFVIPFHFRILLVSYLRMHLPVRSKRRRRKMCPTSKVVTTIPAGRAKRKHTQPKMKTKTRPSTQQRIHPTAKKILMPLRISRIPISPRTVCRISSAVKASTSPQAATRA